MALRNALLHPVMQPPSSAQARSKRTRPRLLARAPVERRTRLGANDRQDGDTLNGWLHRIDGSGMELAAIDNSTEGPKPRISAEQLAQFAQIVDAVRIVRRTGCALIG